MLTPLIRSLPIVVALLACAPSVTFAQDRSAGPTVQGFGQRHSSVFSIDGALEVRRRTQPDTPASTSITLLPAFDYFVIRNLSLGAVAGVKYAKTGDNRTTDFQLGPRVGYDFELSEKFSIWPKLGLMYAHAKFEDHDGSEKNDALQLNLFAPFMFHPAQHFFVGFGPFVETDLNGDSRVTQWGLKLTLGGWV